MIGIKLLDRSFNHEVKELIRAFFPKEDIELGEDRNYKYYIENSLEEDKLTTKFFINGRLETSRTSLIEEDFTKRDIKNKIKKDVYMILEEFISTSVPWGILTGIRPSKLVHGMMDREMEEEEIKRTLEEDYRMKKEKRELIYSIVENERKFIYPLDREKFSIYISIPFCPTTCLYCSFPSCNAKLYRDDIDSYTELLIRELEEVASYLNKDKLSTVYIGGGTPTAIPVENLDRIIGTVYRLYGDKFKEFTVEAGRPDTIKDDFLKMFEANKIDRISINPQTMNDGTLDLIGRSHRSSDIERVYARARELGDYIINMDLIVGLPSEGESELIRTMEAVKKMDPENLTVHTLSVKKGSRFKERMDDYSVEDPAVIESMLQITRDYASEMGMKPYYLYRQKQSMGNFENIGYSKKSQECLYNMHMMEERETILAFGMGGVSKIFYPDSMKIKRVPNFKSLEEYMTRHDEIIARKLAELEKLYGKTHQKILS